MDFKSISQKLTFCLLLMAVGGLFGCLGTLPLAAQTTAPSTPAVEKKEVRQKTGQFKSYKAKRKDTLYGVARANGITVDELTEANPEMKRGDYKLKKGDVIRIPVYETVLVPVYHGLQTIHVAVVLPLLGDGLENKRAVEFYRGMLIGIGQLKDAGINVTVSAYNEPGPDRSIASLAAEIEQTKPDVVVGPLYPAHFTDIASISKRETKVAIPFSSKVPQVNYRPDLFLLNTPVTHEIQLASSLFLNTFKKDVTVVMLNRTDGNKQTFCTSLQKSLLDKGYTLLQFPASSSAATIAKALVDRGGRVVFVPNDASQPVLEALLAMQKDFKALMPEIQTSILGYDKWISLSETGFRNRLHEADAYLLTANYYFPYTKAAMDFNALYERWFKTGLLESYPRMAPLGYDFSVGFLGALNLYGYDFSTQVSPATTVAGQPKLQTDMTFVPTENGGGYVTRSMWLVHFKPDMSIVKLNNP